MGQGDGQMIGILISVGFGLELGTTIFLVIRFLREGQFAKVYSIATIPGLAISLACIMAGLFL